ncbi:hypothetical protein JST97_29620 [bacterium]|nr:hypothetical protein [bacterium]
MNSWILVAAWTGAIVALSGLVFRVWWFSPRSGKTESLLLALAFALVDRSSFDLPLARALLLTAGLCLGWKYSSRPRALYGQDLTWAERVGLLVAPLLAFIHTALLLPQLVLVSRRRRLVPPSLHERLAIHLEAVLLAYALLRTMTGDFACGPQAGQAFQLCLLATLAALYARPGYRKLFHGKRWWHWIGKVGLHYQLLGGYAWGWLPALPVRCFERAIWGLRFLNVPAAASVVLFELATLTLPWRPVWAQAILLGLALFHLAYLALTGACFWENMLLLLAAALSLPELPPDFFGLSTLTLFVPATLCLIKIFDTPALTWWELPLVQRLTTEVVIDRQVQVLSHGWLDPHERMFYTGFTELSPRPLLTHNLSHTDLSLTKVEEILACQGNPHRIQELIGEQTVSPEEIERVRNLLSKVFLGLEAQSGAPRYPCWRAPRSYWARGSRQEVYQGDWPIQGAQIVYQEFFWCQGHILEGSRRVVARFVWLSQERTLSLCSPEELAASGRSIQSPREKR